MKDISSVKKEDLQKAWHDFYNSDENEIDKIILESVDKKTLENHNYDYQGIHRFLESVLDNSPYALCPLLSKVLGYSVEYVCFESSYKDSETSLVVYKIVGSSREIGFIGYYSSYEENSWELNNLVEYEHKEIIVRDIKG